MLIIESICNHHSLFLLFFQNFLLPQLVSTQASEVSSSKPSLLANDVIGPLLLEALEGFLFVVNSDGHIEFVSENVTSFLRHKHVSTATATFKHL